MSGLLYSAGVLELVAHSFKEWLTVLCYHRINELSNQGLDTYLPNVSATPEAFRLQMEYLKSHYNLISTEHLVLWLRSHRELPPRPAIITFDDGYYDNFQYAYPILHKLELPAIIFLSTDMIGSDTPFLWDQAAYCFFHTKKETADLPLFGKVSWRGPQGRQAVGLQWFERMKEVPNETRAELIAALSQVLDVDIPVRAIANQYLNWDQVRELSRNGIEIGSHTESHPILTEVSLERAEREIVDSKIRIEAEIGKKILSFAYPNGGLSDFSPDIMAILRRAGIEAAFTLLPGPTRQTTIRKNPLGIRRVFVSRRDTIPRFVAKLAGAARLISI